MNTPDPLGLDPAVAVESIKEFWERLDLSKLTVPEALRLATMLGELVDRIAIDDKFTGVTEGQE